MPLALLPASRWTANLPARSRLADESGATLLEFCLTVLLFFAMLGASFDLGTALYNRSLLTHAVMRTAREMAIELTTEPEESSCADLELEAADRAEEYLGTGLNIAGVRSFEAHVRQGSLGTGTGPVSPNASPEIEITGSWDIRCLICLFLPRAVTLTATSSAMIESASFSCN